MCYFLWNSFRMLFKAIWIFTNFFILIIKIFTLLTYEPSNSILQKESHKCVPEIGQKFKSYHLFCFWSSHKITLRSVDPIFAFLSLCRKLISYCQNCLKWLQIVKKRIKTVCSWCKFRAVWPNPNADPWFEPAQTDLQVKLPMTVIYMAFDCNIGPWSWRKGSFS